MRSSQALPERKIHISTKLHPKALLAPFVPHQRYDEWGLHACIAKTEECPNTLQQQGWRLLIYCELIVMRKQLRMFLTNA